MVVPGTVPQSLIRVQGVVRNLFCRYKYKLNEARSTRAENHGLCINTFNTFNEYIIVLVATNHEELIPDPS